MNKTIGIKKHLAIFQGEIASDILAGKKTIETRFSKTKIAPFGQVSAGDLVYIKPVGQDIVGEFKVKKVIFYDGLTPEDFLDIKKTYSKQILASENYWQDKETSKYGTLIFIESVTAFITPPIKYSKKDMRGWVTIDTLV